MRFEKSAGAIVCRRENGTDKFLLLHYPSAAHRSNRDYWDFVKGHVETGEKELDTVIREAKEETGLSDLEFAGGFKTSMKYFFRFEGELIFKIVTFRLAFTKTEAITLSGEHNDFAWLSYPEAFEMLSFKNAKLVLAKANDFLKKSNRT